MVVRSARVETMPFRDRLFGCGSPYMESRRTSSGTLESQSPEAGCRLCLSWTGVFVAMRDVSYRG